MNDSALLQALDLNLLRVFDSLYRLRRMAPVAESLGLTQPAVSNALARLRRSLGDELFLRAPAGMQPTAYAQALAGPVAQALRTLHEALQPAPAFAAASSQRLFTLALSDIGEIFFLPPLLQHLARHAPATALQSVRLAGADVAAALQAGPVDMALGLLPQMGSSFYRRRLFTQRYVALLRQGHALDKRRISLKEFSAARHLAVESSGTGHAQVQALLAQAGVQRQVPLRVPHFVALGHLLAGSDLVATVPERLAQALLQPFGLRAVPLPVALPVTPIHMYWHGRVHKDAGHQWLREAVASLFASAAPASLRSTGL